MHFVHDIGIHFVLNLQGMQESIDLDRSSLLLKNDSFHKGEKT